MSPRSRWAVISLENSDCVSTTVPFGFRAQQVLLGDHFEDGTDVLRHAAVHQHEALLQFLAGFGGISAGEKIM